MAEKETRTEIPQTPINETERLEFFRDFFEALPLSDVKLSREESNWAIHRAQTTWAIKMKLWEFL